MLHVESNPSRYFVAAGGLISYGPDSIDQYRRGASYVDRILKGEKPADIAEQHGYILVPPRLRPALRLEVANNAFRQEAVQ